MREQTHRKIIHVDMDCFYAAVEMRDNPALRDIPIAIGGSSDRRGVISTCITLLDALVFVQRCLRHMLYAYVLIWCYCQVECLNIKPFLITFVKFSIVTPR